MADYYNKDTAAMGLECSGAVLEKVYPLAFAIVLSSVVHAIGFTRTFD
jgi:hypothetical protein